MGEIQKKNIYTNKQDLVCRWDCKLRSLKTIGLEQHQEPCVSYRGSRELASASEGYISSRSFFFGLSFSRLQLSIGTSMATGMLIHAVRKRNIRGTQDKTIKVPYLTTELSGHYSTVVYGLHQCLHLCLQYSCFLYLSFFRFCAFKQRTSCSWGSKMNINVAIILTHCSIKLSSSVVQVWVDGQLGPDPLQRTGRKRGISCQHLPCMHC